MDAIPLAGRRRPRGLLDPRRARDPARRARQRPADQPGRRWHLTAAQVGFLGTIYLIGQVAGALFFGRLTDQLGRKKLFIITLAIYLVGSGLGGFAWNFWSLLIFRFFAGTGIGGEYTAINSAIDELIPSHYRGRVDIAVNGTYWAGAALGSGSACTCSPATCRSSWGWRIGFFIGPVLGLIIIFLRRTIPESPRWLMTHGRNDEAEKTVDEIEERIEAEGVTLTQVDESKAMEVTEPPQHRLLRAHQGLLRHLPETLDLRVHDDGHAGVPVQRDLLHLRAGAARSSTTSGRAHLRTTSSRSPSAT